jgi:hypothetical protein
MPRKREPVAGARVHTGRKTRSTASVSIASTGVLRIGAQYRVSATNHCRRWRSFLRVS